MALDERVSVMNERRNINMVDVMINEGVDLLLWRNLDLQLWELEMRRQQLEIENQWSLAMSQSQRFSGDCEK